MQELKQTTFSFIEDPSLEVYIQKAKGAEQQVWIYTNVKGIRSTEKFLIIRQAGRSAYVPKNWVVDMQPMSN